MKTKIYSLFILLTFLCMNGNAGEASNASILWKDLGEITSPQLIHETYNTSYAQNVCGNPKNDIFFTFVVRRTTVFTSNFNGSLLEDVNARLLYSPLDKDNYKSVGEPIPVDHDKFFAKQDIINSMNLTLEEKIFHGWIGTLFIQVLKPGKYVLHCEAGRSCDNGYIRSNIYINPVGTSAEQPKYLGVGLDFNYAYSASFAEQPSGKFYSTLNLRRNMNIAISSKGTKTDALTIKVKDKLSGRVMADSKNYSLEDGIYPRIRNLRLKAGDYILEFSYTGTTELCMNVTGELAGYLPGDLREYPILIPTTSDEVNYQKTFDTRDFTNEYKNSSVSKPTNDVFHRLVLEQPIDILITCPNCEIEGGVTVTLIDKLYHDVGKLDTSVDDELLISSLSAGTYEIVFEGNTNNGIVTLSVIGTPNYGYQPSFGYNYIETITPLISTSTSTLLNNPFKARHRVNYYDGMGRPEQTVDYGVTSDLNDAVGYLEYDGLGRESKNWLPVKIENRGAYMALKDLKTTSSILYQDSHAYDMNMYETSPLSRIVERYGAGEAWQLSGHSVKTGYHINEKADSCKYFVVEGSRSAPELSLRGIYPGNRLSVVSTEDEDGHISYRFTDQKGHVILDRAVTENEMLDTYYVYDDYGNLCFVLPPAAADPYQYSYDHRNRCIRKKLPGCEPVEQVYDCYDRMPFTQDGEQRKRNEWSVALIDIFGRPVISGIYRGTIDRESYGSMHVAAVYAPDDDAACYGYYMNLPDEFNIDSLEITQVNYYDTYDMMEKIPELNYREDENYGKRYVNAQASQHCKGQLTGCFTRVLGSEEELFSAYYYDFNHNMIQERLISSAGREMTAKSAFNFSGNPIATCEEYNGGELRLQKEYLYDQTGKVKEEVHSVDGLDSTRFVYEYNLSGNITSMLRINGNDSLRTTNRYNIRNWLTGINSPVFNEQLYYASGAGTHCYNGNISSMYWKTSEPTLRSYRFSYDRLSRLKDAVYSEGVSQSTNQYTEQVTAYDKMGNILGFKRYGQTGIASFGLIDDLSLSYNGNQLQAVNDQSVNSAYKNGFEFKDGARQDKEYFYDCNGNLTKDLNKKISDIRYNYLNLPARIEFEDGNSVSYLYNANGTKLRTMHVMDKDTLTTDYLGNAIFENGVLTKLLTRQGYITLSDKTYHYYIQDHQGNNRVVVDQSGTVEEENHYYPFGGVFASTSSVQPYKYNGKELDRRNGLDWYDYGARMYDAALGRFVSPDLLSESAYFGSPYVYCLNNPFNRVDPTGMASHYNWNKNQYEDEYGNEVSWGAVQEEYGIGSPSNDIPPSVNDVDGVTGAARQIDPSNVYFVDSDPLIMGEPAFLPETGFVSLKQLRELLKLGNISLKGISFNTFRQFKSVFGSAGEGKAWHHIVEQTPGNIKKFGARSIHNTDNLIKLPHGSESIHEKVSALYSSKKPYSGNMTVREWLSTQTFEEQYDFGIKILKENGWKP